MVNLHSPLLATFGRDMSHANTCVTIIKKLYKKKKTRIEENLIWS